MRSTWNGRKIADAVHTAARLAIDETMARCIAPAKAATPVVTGAAQGSIQFKPAVRTGNRTSGVWGSFNINYFLWLEIGAQGRPGRHMLRNAAAKEYPQLRNRIANRLRSAA